MLAENFLVSFCGLQLGPIRNESIDSILNNDKAQTLKLLELVTVKQSSLLVVITHHSFTHHEYSIPTILNFDFLLDLSSDKASRRGAALKREKCFPEEHFWRIW